MVPPTTMSNPGRLMKTDKEPPIMIEKTTRIVPPARPIIVAISIGSVPEHQMGRIGHFSISPVERK
jgi:hypothetical protein